jgi:hypothetical protein
MVYNKEGAISRASVITTPRMRHFAILDWVKRPVYGLEKFQGGLIQQEALELFFAIESRCKDHSITSGRGV